MQLLLLIAGLVLLLVNPPLFAAAGTVGAICLVVFGVITVAQLAVLAVGLRAKSKFERDFFR